MPSVELFTQTFWKSELPITWPQLHHKLHQTSQLSLPGSTQCVRCFARNYHQVGLGRGRGYIWYKGRSSHGEPHTSRSPKDCYSATFPNRWATVISSWKCHNSLLVRTLPEKNGLGLKWPGTKKKCAPETWPALSLYVCVLIENNLACVFWRCSEGAHDGSALPAWVCCACLPGWLLGKVDCKTWAALFPSSLPLCPPPLLPTLCSMAQPSHAQLLNTCVTAMKSWKECENKNGKFKTSWETFRSFGPAVDPSIWQALECGKLHINLSNLYPLMLWWNRGGNNGVLGVLNRLRMQHVNVLWLRMRRWLLAVAKWKLVLTKQQQSGEQYASSSSSRGWRRRAFFLQ